MENKENFKMAFAFLSPASRDCEKDPGVKRRYARLRKWRNELAKAWGTPPYTILNNQTLKEIALLQPRTAPELLAIPGMGRAKLAQYGRAVLHVLKGE